MPSPAKRGDIVDRRGRVLATSVDADTIYAVPTEIDDAADAANKICDALGDCDAQGAAGARRAARPAARVRVRAAAGRARSGASASRR